MVKDPVNAPKQLINAPKAEKQVASSSGNVSTGQSLQQRRALVIDDSLVIRKSLAMALKKMSFEVTQAVDGLEGLKHLKENTFDLLLCDFLMPVMDGFDCVKQYRDWERKNRNWFHQLIVGISAHANEQVAAQGIEAGMDDFKPKPISIKYLKELEQSDDVCSCSNLLNQHEAPAGIPAEVDSNLPVPLWRRKRDLSTDNILDEITSSWVAMKRPRVASSNDVRSAGGSTDAVCLIATDRPSKTPSEALTSLEAQGWEVVVVCDGIDALRLLQTRNWNAVLIDEDLPLLSGRGCISKFRDWETQNRVNRQQNIFIVVDLDIPSPLDGTSLVQPPYGFDFVLRKPVMWNDMKHFLQKGGMQKELSIVMNHV
jgi:CheY-like chemotaxis protein